MIKMSDNAHGALEKIVGSILRTYGMESLLAALITELDGFKATEYTVHLSNNLKATLQQYQERYLQN